MKVSCLCTHQFGASDACQAISADAYLIIKSPSRQAALTFQSRHWHLWRVPLYPRCSPARIRSQVSGCRQRCNASSSAAANLHPSQNPLPTQAPTFDGSLYVNLHLIMKQKMENYAEPKRALITRHYWSPQKHRQPSCSYFCSIFFFYLSICKQSFVGIYLGNNLVKNKYT